MSVAYKPLSLWYFLIATQMDWDAKYSRQGGLHDRSLFVDSLEARCPRSRCREGWFFLRPLSWPYASFMSEWQAAVTWLAGPRHMLRGLFLEKNSYENRHCVLFHVIPGLLRTWVEVPAGECSYSYTLDWRLVFLYWGWLSFSIEHATLEGRQTHGVVRDKEDSHLASHMSWINPGDQWGHRYCSHITLASMLGLLKTNLLSIYTISKVNNLAATGRMCMCVRRWVCVCV